MHASARPSLGILTVSLALAGLLLIAGGCGTAPTAPAAPTSAPAAPAKSAPAAPAPTTAAPKAAAAPAAPAAPAAAKPSVYKVGGSLCLSGPNGDLGARMREGMETAVQDINTAGGIGGVKVEVEFEDNRSQPQTGLDVMNKLVSVDQVPVVYSCSSAVILATLPVAAEKHILMLNTSAAAPNLVGASPWLFNAYLINTEQVRAMLPYLYDKLGYKKLALYVRNDDFGLKAEEVVKGLWPKTGGTITGSEYHDKDTQNHTAQVAKLKQMGADAVYLLSSGRDGVTFIKQGRDLGLSIPIVSWDGMETKELLDVAGPAAEGIVYTAPYYNLDSTDPITQRFMATFKAKYPSSGQPHFYAVSYYDGMLIWADLVRYTQEKNLPYNGDSLKKALLDLRSFTGIGGAKTVFRDDGSSAKSVALKAVKGGKFVTLQAIESKQ